MENHKQRLEPPDSTVCSDGATLGARELDNEPELVMRNITQKRANSTSSSLAVDASKWLLVASQGQEFNGEPRSGSQVSSLKRRLQPTYFEWQARELIGLWGLVVVISCCCEISCNLPFVFFPESPQIEGNERLSKRTRQANMIIYGPTQVNIEATQSSASMEMDPCFWHVPRSGFPCKFRYI